MENGHDVFYDAKKMEAGMSMMGFGVDQTMANFEKLQLTQEQKDALKMIVKHSL